MKKLLLTIAMIITMATTAQAEMKQIIVCTDDGGCEIVTIFTDD